LDLSFFLVRILLEGWSFEERESAYDFLNEYVMSLFLFPVLYDLAEMQSFCNPVFIMGHTIMYLPVLHGLIFAVVVSNRIQEANKGFFIGVLMLGKR
jgi:hypothetical protein